MNQIKLGQKWLTRLGATVTVIECIRFKGAIVDIQPYTVREDATGERYNVTAGGYDCVTITGHTPIEGPFDLVTLVEDAPEGQQTKIEPYFGSEELSIERIVA